MQTTFRDTPIAFLKGVGPQKALLLKNEIGVETFGDLLHYYPYRYIDRSRIFSIAEITDQMPYVQVKGTIVHTAFKGQKQGRRFVAQLRDETGVLELVWFQGLRWVEGVAEPGKTYIVFGKPSLFNGKLNIAHPEMESPDAFAQMKGLSLHGLYNSTDKLKRSGLDSKGISRLMLQLIQQMEGQVPEYLPDELLRGHRLLSLEQALHHIHQPSDNEILQKAIFRLKFDEILLIQLKLLKAKHKRQLLFKGFVFGKVGDRFNQFYNHHLPFTLTTAQKKVIREIRNDLGSGKQMNRLLQGDVGSGKTVVALMSALIAMDNGYQVCIMAPTEILATQHYRSMQELLKEMPVTCALLTGSTTVRERKILHAQLLSGELDLLIGTHALIEETVQFKNLGLTIIDEQHRFGVAQRSRLWAKNTIPPHILVMTATPIPRTLAMTLYGDLDISVINELPPGRKPIKTIHRFDVARTEVYNFLSDQIQSGRQVYIVYPLIEESDKLAYRNLMDGYDQVRAFFPAPRFHVSVVHGKMKPAEKAWEMERFVKGFNHIMVATTVIEVGVNVPNASVMLIESAEKFGLSQLHQLRGRVGRGADQSYCILLSSHKLSTEARMRIETMVRTTDGFEIAEVDLKLRGPGDVEGTRQSGQLDLKITNLYKDQPIIELVRNEATLIIERDPDLQLPEHQSLLQHLMAQKKDHTNWSRIS